jgi:6-phosphogluconolactonase
VTWTYPTINASEQVWLVVTGASKASAAQQLQAGAPLEEIPAVGVHGKQITRLIVDVDAYNTSI